MLTVMIDAEKTERVTMTALFKFSDTQTNLRVIIRKGVCQVSIYNINSYYSFKYLFPFKKSYLNSKTNTKIVVLSNLWSVLQKFCYMTLFIHLLFKGQFMVMC